MRKIAEGSSGDFCTITVHISPGAKQNEYLGINTEGVMRIRISAPPVDGKANLELLVFLGKLLNIPTSRIQILHGEKSKRKFIKILGINQEEINKILLSA